MYRLGWVLLFLFLLAGCAAPPPLETPPATAASPTAPATTAITPTQLPASPTPDNSLLSPEMLPTPAPASQVNPAEVLGVDLDRPVEDQIIYARADGAVILHDLASGDEQELLGAEHFVSDQEPGMHYFLVPILAPAAISPDGRWLLQPTRRQGTWLVAMDGSQQRQINKYPIAATWAPDSRRITYTNSGIQRHPPHPNAIFVQDVVAGEAPQVLAELPSRPMYAYWSPGCPEDSYASGSSCGRHIASITCSDSELKVCTVWMVDVSLGDARAACQFSTRFRDSAFREYAWDETGFDFWLLSKNRTCTISGDTLPLSRAFDFINNVISPDQRLWAFYDPDAVYLPNMKEPLSIRNAQTAAGVFYQARNRHLRWWTQDGAHLVVVMGPEVGHNIFLLNPATSELTPIADNVTFLGVVSHLRRQGVLTTNLATGYRMLPDAGPAADWPAFYLPELKMTVRVPAGWRVQQAGRGRYVISNFALDRAVGVIRLSPQTMEIVIQRGYGRSTHIDPDAWLDTVKVTQQGETLEELTLAGHPAVRIIDKTRPFSEVIGTFNENYTVTITRSSLNPTYDAIFQQILNSIRWDVN